MIGKIDVTIASKNNEDTIQRCIVNIKKFIPYNKIIVIDDSTDNTPQIAKDLGAIVYHVPALLGEKRYLQAKLSETEWIAIIDSDIFVFPNWWREMSKEIKPGVGVINGFLASDFEQLFPSYEKYTKFKSLKHFERTGLRAAIGNNLIRRDLLLSLKENLVNKNIHAGEDTVIGEKIRESSYTTKVVTNPIGFHFHNDPIEHHCMAYKREGESIIKKNGLKGIINLFFGFVNIQINWITYSYNSRGIDFKLYKFLIELYYSMLKGGFQEFKLKIKS
jgi:glycosyltransferase involved in cell wall biosynthesis